MKSIIFVVTIILSPLAFAGSFSGGGGGTVALCTSKSGEMTKIELLDLAYMIQNGRVKRGDLPGYGDAAKIVEQVAHEVSATSSYEGDYLARRSNWFLKSAKFQPKLSGIPFDVNPSLVATIKYNGFCKRAERFSIRLVALQDFEARRVTFDSTVWNHPLFTEFDKAALVFHEAWYAYLFDAATIGGEERPEYLEPAQIYEKVYSRFLTR